MSVSPFDTAKNLLGSKENIWSEELRSVKAYNAFMVNRVISMSYDTVLYANEMNRYNKLSTEQQYHYYHHAIQPKKFRKTTWVGEKKSEDSTIIREYFKCNQLVADQYMKLLTDDDIEKIKSIMDKGGRN